MFALIAYIDGFGNDSYVKGIYATLEEAQKDFNPYGEENRPDQIVKFSFGQVNFGYRYPEYKSCWEETDKELGMQLIQ